MNYQLIRGRRLFETRSLSEEIWYKTNLKEDNINIFLVLH